MENLTAGKNNISEEDILKSIKNIAIEYEAKKDDFEKISKPVKHILRSILDENNIAYFDIKYRVKKLDSLSEKIRKKANKNNNIKYKSLSSITDILGVRVILMLESDIDKVVDIINKEFIVDEENSVDRRKGNVNEFGYLSYHQIVELNTKRPEQVEYKKFEKLKFEIQTRTILQHAWAETEHKLGYKAKEQLPLKKRRMLNRLSATLELVDKSFLDVHLHDEYQISHKELNDFIERNKTIRDIHNKFFWSTKTQSIRTLELVLKNFKKLGVDDIQSLQIVLAQYEKLLILFIEQLLYRYPWITYKNDSNCLIYLIIVMNLIQNKEFKDYMGIFDVNKLEEGENLYKVLNNSLQRATLIKKLNIKGSI